MHKSSEIERNWLEFKRKSDFYYSRILGYPLCPPEHVYFSLTNRCNLRCKMCGIAGSPNEVENELRIDECRRIIDQIVSLKIGHLIFSGGEPLLRGDLFDLVSYAVTKKIPMVDVITNGTLVDDGLARKIVGLGLNHVTVSIDGLEENDDFIRGQGAFRKAMQAIDLINKHKKGTLPTVGINFTIMDRNIEDIIPMIELARAKGCNIIVLQPMLSDNTDMQERKKNELWVTEENLLKLEQVIANVLELKKNAGGFSIHVTEKILQMIPAYFSGAPLDNNLKCYEGIVRIVISYAGDLWTCQGIYGNLRKNDLCTAWRYGEIDKIRQKVKECRNHCLQSCIQLPELSDVYSEAERLQAADENKVLAGRMARLFKKYRFLLRRRAVAQYLKSLLLGGKGSDGGNEITGEITKVSSVINDHGGRIGMRIR